jgi:hypothetical protein
MLSYWVSSPAGAFPYGWLRSPAALKIGDVYVEDIHMGLDI